MPSSLKVLPPSEWRLIYLIWRHGPMTANEVLELIPEYSITGLSTLLRRLVSKDYLRTTLETPVGPGRPPERFHPRVDYETGFELVLQTFFAEYIFDDAEGLARLADATQERLAEARKPHPPRDRATVPLPRRGKIS